MNQNNDFMAKAKLKVNVFMSAMDFQKPTEKKRMALGYQQK